jgi:hypothetical protein
MKKEPSSDSLPDLGEVFPSTHNIQFVPAYQRSWLEFNLTKWCFTRLMSS